MKTHSILIAEDDIELSELIAEVLQFEGFESKLVHDGNLVYDQVVTMAPDVLILDMHLPHMSGMAILSRIQANPNLAQMKILVATADVLLARAIHTQVDMVFEKPYSINQLVQITNRLVQAR